MRCKEFVEMNKNKILHGKLYVLDHRDRLAVNIAEIIADIPLFICIKIKTVLCGFLQTISISAKICSVIQNIPRTLLPQRIEFRSLCLPRRVCRNPRSKDTYWQP